MELVVFKIPSKKNGAKELPPGFDQHILVLPFGSRKIGLGWQ